MIRLSGIFTYPLKSARGFASDSASLDRFGLMGDRRYMLVDPEGRFVTARRVPRLSLVEAHPTPLGLIIRLPDGDERHVQPNPTSPPRLVEVWGDTVEARHVSPSVDAWMSGWLERPVSLVYMPETTYRRVDERFARREDTVSFADGFSLLLISQGSLDALNRHLEKPVGMDRFRPNLVVDGCAPFAEDQWRQIRIGECTFEIVKPCGRCVMVNVDPETGETCREPLRTLSTFRARDREVLFGQNLIHRTLGVIQVGATVRIMDARSGGAA